MGFADRLPALIEEWQAHQERKAKDYNGSGIENADVLGVRGQFADVWRKIWKLKKALWDGETLVGEQPREILLDLIGHCFLTIDMLDRTPLPDQVPLPGQVPSKVGTERREAGWLALRGSPAKLEAMGLFLGDAQFGDRDDCRRDQHILMGNCKYRIYRRRVDA